MDENSIYSVFFTREFESMLKRYLKQTMLKLVITLAAYVKTHFGPSNMKGTRPSAPGKAPNIGMGILRNSITQEALITSHDVIGVYGVSTGPATAYARALELGYVGRNRILEARPFLRPAYLAYKRRIIKILAGY